VAGERNVWAIVEPDRNEFVANHLVVVDVDDFAPAMVDTVFDAITDVIARAGCHSTPLKDI